MMFDISINYLFLVTAVMKNCILKFVRSAAGNFGLSTNKVVNRLDWNDLASHV